MRYLATLLLLACIVASPHAEEIGKLGNLTGVVSVLHRGGQQGLAYAGAALAAGDVVATEKDSTALLLFSDGSQVALRPNTRFQVAEYRYAADEPKNDSLVVRLLKGGLRTLTGFIGKRGNPEAYRLHGGTATIGIRGTDFTARLCEADCAAEDSPDSRKGQPAPKPAGQVARLDGSLIAIGLRGEKRVLKYGHAIYPGEQLEMGNTGYAALVMADDSKIVLQAGSRFAINEFRFAPQSPQKSRMAVELLRGAFRIVTGWIGKSKPDQLTIRSTTATIGIRGTDFDAVCTPPGKLAGGTPPVHDCDGGLLVAMREGVTAVKSGEAVQLVRAGEAAYVEAPGSTPVLLESIPDFIQFNPAPLPATIGLDPALLEGGSGQVPTPGFYAEVHDGGVDLSQGGTSIVLEQGTSGLAAAGGAAPIELPVTPRFLDADPYLSGFPFAGQTCAAP